MTTLGRVRVRICGTYGLRTTLWFENHLHFYETSGRTARANRADHAACAACAARAARTDLTTRLYLTTPLL